MVVSVTSPAGDGTVMIFWDPKIITVTVPRGAKRLQHVNFGLLAASLNNDILFNSLGAQQVVLNADTPSDAYLPPTIGAAGGLRILGFVDLEFTRTDLGLNQEISATLAGRDMNLQPFSLSAINVKFAASCKTGNVYVFPCSATNAPSEQPGDDTSPRMLLAANALFGVYTQAFTTTFGTPPGAANDDFSLTRRFFDTRRTEHLAFRRQININAMAAL